MKKCPFCAEDIQDAAIVCKHCRRDLAPVGVAPTTPPPPVAASPAAQTPTSVAPSAPAMTATNTQGIGVLLALAGFAMTVVGRGAGGFGIMALWIGLALLMSGSQTRRWGGGLVLALIIGSVGMMMGGNSAPQNRTASASAPSATAPPASAPSAPTATASSQDTDAACRQDLRCFAEKHTASASVYCKEPVERLAKNNFEWTDGFLEQKFSHYRWKDKENGVVTHIGDKIKYQNGFGAWTYYTYECDLASDGETVLDVRARPGRLE